MQTYQSYKPVQPHSRPQKKRVGRRLGSLLLVVAVVMVGLHAFGDSKLFGLSTDRSKVSASAIGPTVLSPSQESAMAAKINAAIRTYPDMDIGVAIEDLNDGKAYHYGLSNPFIAASTAKLITATMYLQGVESGKYSLSNMLSYGSAQYELRQMIVQSDNTAWQDFNTILTHDGLENYATDIGLTNYDPDQNTLTVDDIALLLGKLYKGELLSRTFTDMMLSYMHNANEANYIVASVPAGVKVYHKAGWLDDRVLDAAIIDNGKHPYVLTIFTKDINGSYDATEGHQIFSSITGATVNAFL